MHLPPRIAESLGWLALEFAKVQPLVPTYTHLLASALFPIYTGAHASLSRPSSAAKPEKKSPDDEEEVEQKMEGLSPSDAIVFPILAGSTLVGLYFLIKWLQDPAILNKILNAYFAIFSVFAVGKLVSDGLDVFHSYLFPRHYIDQGKVFTVYPETRNAYSSNARHVDARNSPMPWIFSRLPLPRKIMDLVWFLFILPSRKLVIKGFVKGVTQFKIRLGIHGIEGTCVGLATVLFYNFVSKPWWLTNLMGFGFSYGALQLMSPTTFATGSLILSSLFFYDVYFVFFTPMMVTVAKSLDVPIKLLFPRPADSDSTSTAQSLSMLGLGDVVLPGMMIGLALRFDLFRFYVGKQYRRSEPEKYSDWVVPTPGESDSTYSASAFIDTNVATEKPEESGLGRQDQAGTAGEDALIVKSKYVSVSETWGDRFWMQTWLRRAVASHSIPGVFPKPYFHASLVGYVVGMLCTLGAMQVSNHPQPALLYLVPGVLLSIWGTAAAKGELKAAWKYSDASTDEYTDSENRRVSSKEAAKSKSFFSKGTQDLKVKNFERAMAKHVSYGTEKEADDDDANGSGKTEPAPKEIKILSFSISIPPALKLDPLQTSPQELLLTNQSMSNDLGNPPKSADELSQSTQSNVTANDNSNKL